jgi:hypothetical protein
MGHTLHGFGSWRGPTAIAAALLLVVAGFCLFDTDPDGDGTGTDLCGTLIAVPLVLTVFVPSALSGLIEAERLLGVHVAAFRIPDPPPKSPSPA